MPFSKGDNNGLSKINCQKFPNRLQNHWTSFSQTIQSIPVWNWRSGFNKILIVFLFINAILRYNHIFAQMYLLIETVSKVSDVAPRVFCDLSEIFQFQKLHFHENVQGRYRGLYYSIIVSCLYFAAELNLVF